jgi:hypothetical protein
MCASGRVEVYSQANMKQWQGEIPEVQNARGRCYVTEQAEKSSGCKECSYM